MCIYIYMYTHIRIITLSLSIYIYTHIHILYIHIHTHINIYTYIPTLVVSEEPPAGRGEGMYITVVVICMFTYITSIVEYCMFVLCI